MECHFCAEMLGSCIGVAVLAILYEGLKVLRDLVDAKCGCRGPDAGCGQIQGSSSSNTKSLSTDDDKQYVYCGVARKIKLLLEVQGFHFCRGFAVGLLPMHSKSSQCSFSKDKAGR